MMQQYIDLLSALTLSPPSTHTQALRRVCELDPAGRKQLLQVADAHHVIVRALTALANVGGTTEYEVQEWAKQNLQLQRERIGAALAGLDKVCRTLEAHNCAVTVLKSLDHWPDVGSDFDLYSNCGMDRIAEVLISALHAQPLPRSWGDRLARKMGFSIPGVEKTLEMHSGRLGQTGEHVELARRFERRRKRVQIEGYTFFIPAPEEQVLAASMQRMYRHLFFRICDVVNTTALLQAGSVDLFELCRAARAGGIWPGVSTYLRVVCEYASSHGSRVGVPQWVQNSAAFGAEELFVRGRFLRFPVFPHGVGLYARQVKSAVVLGKAGAALRLGVLPPLASAAAVAFKVTGSNQGIW